MTAPLYSTVVEHRDPRTVSADDFPIGSGDWADFGDYIAAFKVVGYRCPNIVVIEVRLDERTVTDYYPAQRLAEMIEAA